MALLLPDEISIISSIQFFKKILSKLAWFGNHLRGCSQVRSVIQAILIALLYVGFAIATFLLGAVSFRLPQLHQLEDIEA